MTQYCTCSCIKPNQKIQKTSKEDGPYLVSDMYDNIPPYSAWSTEPSMTKYLQYSMGAASKLGPAFRHKQSIENQWQSYPSQNHIIYPPTRLMDAQNQSFEGYPFKVWRCQRLNASTTLLGIIFKLEKHKPKYHWAMEPWTGKDEDLQTDPMPIL